MRLRGAIGISTLPHMQFTHFEVDIISTQTTQLTGAQAGAPIF
jgi:hypothetical protein